MRGPFLYLAHAHPRRCYSSCLVGPMPMIPVCARHTELNSIGMRYSETDLLI